MKINFLSTQNNYQKTSFKGVDYFSHIKSIPNMTCAICGKPTISSEFYAKTITPLAKPLAYNMSKGALNYLNKKFPLVWTQLEKFTEQFPKKSLDEILVQTEPFNDLKKSVVKTLETEPIPTDTPERIELDRKIGSLFFDTIEHARSYMKSSSVVMNHLMPLKAFLDGTRKDVFEQFEIYSRKYPRKTLSEIVNIPEISKFHTIKNLLQRVDSREQLDYHFENIRNLVQKKNPSAVDYFDELKEKTLDLYEKENDEKARTYYTKELYKNALKEYDCEELENDVLRELSLIPKSFITKDSFFNSAKVNQYNDGRIVSSLFSGILASEEHINPVSKGGEDKLGNKIVAHRSCNTLRHAIPYTEFIKYHPSMPEYTQAQIDLVTQHILDGKTIDALRTYPLYVAENLYKQSEGKIDINIDKYCEKGLRQSLNRTTENKNKIAEKTAAKQKIEQEIGELTNLNRLEKGFQYRLQEYLTKHY